MRLLQGRGERGCFNWEFTCEEESIELLLDEKEEGSRSAGNWSHKEEDQWREPTDNIQYLKPGASIDINHNNEM